MQIVINIPENIYNLIARGEESRDFVYKSDLMRAILEGTPLPKGHGAIIDIKEIEEFWKEHEIGHDTFTGELLYDAGRTSRHDVIWKPLLDVLPTIIEADKRK